LSVAVTSFAIMLAGVIKNSFGLLEQAGQATSLMLQFN
jgi:hypothetical protein